MRGRSYFKQSVVLLERKRKDVYLYLKLKGYSTMQINKYLVAYDYFVLNPNKYDGATIVKDLVDLHNLDLDAMLHDYNYVYLKKGHNFISKWKADLYYAKEMERKGKGIYASWSRFIGLTISGIFFVPYTNIKTFLKK